MTFQAAAGRKVRVAVGGLGAVVHNIHLPAYARLRKKMELVGGCDPDSERRTQFTRRTGAPAFEDLADLLSQSRPDIVAVCTPPEFHSGNVLQALSAGCHVFCEKPLVSSLAEADVLIAAAQAAHRHLVVNSQFPAMKIHAAAKAAIQGPSFGRLLFLQATQTFRPTGKTEAGWRSLIERRVGLEFGVHVFELIRYFFEEDPLRISALMPNPFPGQSGDSIIITTLEFSGGRAAAIILDRASKGPERYLDLRLDGEKAAIATSIGGEVRLEAGLHTRQRRPFFNLSIAGGGKAILQDGIRSTLLAREGLNPFAFATAVQLERMIDVMANGGDCPGSARDHRKTLALALAAYDAAEAGRALDLKPYLEGPASA